MANQKKVIDPIPESFATYAEAGEFWDTHSAADYLELLEPVDHEINIVKRTYEVQISEDVFKRLQHEAETSHRPMRTVLDGILRKELSTV